MSYQGFCKVLRRSLLISAAVLLTGCAQKKMTQAEFENMCKPPPRPEEYKQLDYMVGTWEMNGEMTMDGVEGTQKMTGKDVVAWDTDNWVLTEHMECSMGSCKSKGLGIWFWDGSAKKFKVAMYDSSGTDSHGWATYNEKDRTYHMKATGKCPMNGQNVTMDMTFKIVDNNTLDCHMTMSSGMSKMGEGHGTSKRMK